MKPNDAFNLWSDMTTRERLTLILVLVLLSVLATACDDGTFAEQQRIAEFNQKVSRACIPMRGEFVTLKWEKSDQGYTELVVRRYDTWAKGVQMTKTTLEAE